ncbi:hypothetical protein G3M54_33290 [Bacillus megaterium NBRC 15308 = ATCC 14581]|nr:hypothetical protein [Priestia megaterium NBRC 15308 = ATCC 14581]
MRRDYFRGAMFHYFDHLPFHLSTVAIGIISSLLFGIVHLYQGWKGVLFTSYLGGIMFFFLWGQALCGFLSHYISLLIRSLSFA